MRMPAPSRTPIPHRRRPTIGASAMMSPPRKQETLVPFVVNPLSSWSRLARQTAGPVPASRPLDPWAARQLRLRRASWPDDAADDLDDDERDEPAKQHVAEIVAAEGEPQAGSRRTRRRTRRPLRERARAGEARSPARPSRSRSTLRRRRTSSSFCSRHCRHTTARTGSAH